MLARRLSVIVLGVGILVLLLPFTLWIVDLFWVFRSFLPDTTKAPLFHSLVELAGRPSLLPLLLMLVAAVFLLSYWVRFLVSLGGEVAGIVRDPSGATQRLLLVVDRITTWVGKLFGWCIVLLTFAVSYEVLSRKLIGRPTTWAFDTSYILYGALFMMAGAYTLARNGHVRGDFLYRQWPPRAQAGLDLVLYFLFFFPGILALIYSGYGFSGLSWRMAERSAFSPAGPPIYPFKSLIPVAGALLLLQGVAEVIRCGICLRRGAWPPRLHDVEELENVILRERAREEQQAALEDLAAAERAAR